MGAAQIFDLDKGTAAGLLAGATTESASIGTAGDDIGEETSNLQGLGVIGETRDVVITNGVLVGRALRTARRLVDPDLRRRVFVYKLNPIGQDIELRPGARFQAGDIITLNGPADAVKQVGKMIGYSTDRDLGVDYVYLGLDIVTGILIRMITVNIAGASMALHTGGGCLISGLVFGWLRSKGPTFGSLQAATALHLRDFRLAIFIAGIGLAAGP